MEDFLDNVIKDVASIKAMNVISENYSLIWAKKEIDFWQKVEENLHKTVGENYSIGYLSEYFENEKLSHNKLNSMRTKSGRIRQPFGIYLEKIIENTNYYISISVLYDNNKEIKSDFKIFHQQSDNEKTNKIIRDLNESIITPIVSQVNFYHYKDNNNLTYDLFEEEFFNEITDELTDEIVKYINLVDKIFKDISKAI